MQHLPFLPQRQIPYLGGPAYLGEGLESSVNHRNWTPASLSRNNFNDRSLRSRLAFLQSFLNVALVIEFLQIRDVKATHKTFCPNGTAIDTSKLPGLINAMGRAGESLTSPEKEKQYHRAKRIMDSVSVCTPDYFWRNTDEVTLAMGCMLHTLARLTRLLNIEFEGELPRFQTLETGQHARPIELLSQAGWCQRQIAELYNFTNAISLYYITTLSRVHQRGDHANCTATRCIASQVDSETYETNHITSCSGCDHISVDEGEIIKQVEKGIVPRLSVNTSLEIQVMDAGPYAAISHVWAHGQRISSQTPAHEFLWRLALSDWARRLWTYEEYRVSDDRVLVRCEEGFVDLSEMFAKFVSIPLSAEDDAYQYDAYDLLHIPPRLHNALYHATKNEASVYPFFVSSVLAQQTSNLSTSRLEDETLCLASVLDFDTGPLTLLDPKDRMEKLLSDIEALPARILFGQGYRSERSGLGWAPAAFLVHHYWPPTVAGIPPVGHYRTIPKFGGQKGFDVVLGCYELTKYAARILQQACLKLPGPNAPFRNLRYFEQMEDPRAWWLDWARGRCELDATPGLFMPGKTVPRLKLILLRSFLEGPGILVQSLENSGGVERVRFIARVEVNPVVDYTKNWTWKSLKLDWRQGVIVVGISTELVEVFDGNIWANVFKIQQLDSLVWKK
ncbi:MAG: hypothetical protein Q9213_005178 [Squamulea squamosa]